MRIALIAPPWLPVPPPAYGGTEVVVDNLARGFVAAGHEVILFATGDSTCPVPTAWTYQQAASARLGNSVVETRHLIDAYDTVKGCDVVHDHTMLGPLYSERFPGLRVVTTAHGELTSEVLPLYRELRGRVAIVAISRDQASRTEDVPIARVIHHGLDLNAFPLGDGHGGHLLFLGRMTPGKGVREAALVAHATGAPLKIAAKCREPREIDYFESEIRPLLGGPVEYVGEVGGVDKLELLTGARALVNPIQWAEPFGLVMAEALACGTPVLAFPSGSAPEIVVHGRTGFLCDDVADMAAAVEHLDQIDRVACRAAAETRFSVERMVADHLDLYAEMVSSVAPSPEPLQPHAA